MLDARETDGRPEPTSAPQPEEGGGGCEEHWAQVKVLQGEGEAHSRSFSGGG